MTVYPMNVKIAGKLCAVVGGGHVAYRKVKALLKAEAAVTVISPVVTADLHALSVSGKIRHLEKCYAYGDVSSYFLVICAADSCEVNREAAGEAKEHGALVNVVDSEELSDFIVPAQVCRGDLLLTVSTGGKSPALSRQLRKELEEMYDESYGDYVALMAKLRDEMKCALATSWDREAFWRQAMDEEIVTLLKQGKLDKAEAKIRNAIASFRVKS